MRERVEIEKEFHPSGRSVDPAGIVSQSILFFLDLIENQQLLLEVMLDIRELLKREGKLREDGRKNSKDPRAKHRK